MQRGTIGPGEARTAQITKLPDGRYRVEHWLKLTASRTAATAAFRVYGSTDPAPAAGRAGSAGAGARLINQSIVELEGKPHLYLVYETIPATGELQLGLNTRIKLEDGREAIEAEFIQLQADTYVPGTVGTLTAPGDASAYLKESVATNDGTVRRIKRTYVYAGTIATNDESLNNGALLKRTIVSVKTVPSTPSGYTLVGSPVQAPNGLPTYSYTYYKGDGQISYDPSSDNNGALLKIAIRHLTAPGASNPIGTPAGYTLVSGPTFQEAEGHMIWSASYAKGAGQISYDPSSDNNGALLRVAIRHLTAPSASNPISTPSGYSLVSGPTYQEAAGHMIWSAAYAKGDGEISRDTDRSQNGTTVDASVGVTRLSIAYLTAPAASEPIWSGVSGYVQISVRSAKRDGHLLWTAIYAKGAGTVADSVSTRSMGKLKIYRLVGLGAAPTAPAATIGGTVTLFDTDVRQAEGHIVYDYRWAEAEPDGRTGLSTATRADGSIVYTVTELGVAVDTPAYPGSGTAYLVDLDNNTSEGHYVNRAVYIKPPATDTLKQPHVFDMPGTVSLQSTADGHNLLLSPSKKIPIQADVEVSYSTSQLTTAHYYVAYGAYLNAAYVRDGQTQGESQQEAFSNYVSAGGTATGTTGDEYNDVVMESYALTLAASSPTARPTGATVIAPPLNEKYLMALDGTIVYRRTKISYTF
jgi:hypothetical protein